MKTKRFVPSIAFVLGLFLAAHAHAGVPDGRALLFNNGEPTMAGLAAAHAQFLAAVAANPNDAEANFFLAATRLMMLVDDNASYTPGAPVENVKELLDGLGVTGAGRDIFNWAAHLPENAQGHFTSLPVNSPSGPDLQNVMTSWVLPQIDAALANLDKVGSGFVTVITAAEAGSTHSTEVDYGDVLMARAGLYFLRMSVRILTSYDHYADAYLFCLTDNDGSVFQRLLDNHPGLLKLLSSGDAKMGNARADFLNAAATYFAASTHIRNESDDQTDDFVTIEDEDLADEAHFRVQLAEAKASLEQARVAAIENQEGTETDHIDLNRFFGTASLIPVDLRSLMPFFDSLDYIVAGTFPDTTMGGILVDCTTEPLLVDFARFDIVFPVHEKTITIDGQETDWQEIPAIPRGYFASVGYEGWQEPYDVQYVKVARDQTHWYWMVRLNLAVIPTYFQLRLSGEFSGLGANWSNWSGPSYSYHWWSNSNPYSTMGGSPADVVLGTVIEGKIPLNLVELEGPLGLGFYAQSVNHVSDGDILTTESVPGIDIGPNLMATDSVNLSGRSLFAANPIQSWQWSLKHRGNPALNRTAAGATPSIAGLAPGLYDVVVTATDAGGQTHTATSLLSATGTAQTYTQVDLDQAVQTERARWDVGIDNGLGLPEAVQALQTVSGLR